MFDRMMEWVKTHQVLAGIVAVGFLLRIWGLFWGLPFLDSFEGRYHPDEGRIIRGAVLFPEHIFTNKDFIYPTFFHYFLGIITLPLRLFFDTQGLSEPGLLDSTFYDVVTLIGRLCSILAGTGAIVFTYLLTKDIYDQKRALLASAFLALTFYHATNSSFATPDVLTSFFLVLFLFVLRRAFLTPQTPSLFVLSGITLGLLVGTKYTGAIASLAILVMYVYTLGSQSPSQKEGGHVNQRKLHLHLLLCGAATIVTFVITTPGALFQFNFFHESIFETFRYVERGSLPRSDLGVWLGVFNKFVSVVGLPLASICIWGLFFPYKKNVYEMSYIVILIAFFVYCENTLVPRWIILVTPLVAIIGSNGVFWVYESGKKPFQILGLSMITIVLVYSLGYSATGAYQRYHDTRTQVGHYLHDTFPKDTTLGIGYVSEEFVGAPLRFLYPKIDLTWFRSADFLDYPEVVIVSRDWHIKHIEHALTSDKLSEEYVWDEQYNYEWFKFSPPSPRIFRFYEELFNPEESKYILLKTFKKKRLVPVEFGSPEIRIYLRQSYSPNTVRRTYYPSNPREYFQEEDTRKWRWQIGVQPGNEANLVFPPKDPEVVRVAISRADTDVPWHIQLNQIPVGIKVRHNYVIRFRARADHPRSMTIAVHQAYDPWQNLGLHQGVALTAEWQDYTVEFKSRDDEANAQVYFDLGESAVPVEIAEVTLEKGNPTWHLWVQEGSEAELVVPPEDPEVLRVAITQADTDTPSDIQLNQIPLVVQANEWYSLRFRARANALRNMAIAVGHAHDPWKSLGLYRTVAVMREWQDYEMEFRATADDENARVFFDLGAWNVTVEIAAVRLLQLSHGTPKWWLKLREGSEAGLVVPSADPEVLRIAITEATRNKPQHIQLIQKPLVIQNNTRYRAEFWARADAPRQTRVVVTQAENPWKNLGLDQVVSLTPEWQLFDMEFVAKGAEGNAKLQFDLGGSNVPVEITAGTLQSNAEILLESLGSPIHTSSGARARQRPSAPNPFIEPDLPDKYYVEYRFNALGCRGRDYPIPRSHQGRRLLILGDSFALGAGVHEADTLASQLELLLNQEERTKRPKIIHEVINCGVSRYGTRDERIIYETLVSKYEPDLVLLVMTPDDDRSWIGDVNSGVFDHLGKNPKKFVSWSDHKETLFQRSSPDYSGSLQAIDDLHQLVQDRGAHLAVVLFRHTKHQAWNSLVTQITEGLQDTAVPVWDLGPALRRNHSEHDLTVNEVDKHPNEMAHKIAAETILSALKAPNVFSPPDGLPNQKE